MISVLQIRWPLTVTHSCCFSFLRSPGSWLIYTLLLKRCQTGGEEVFLGSRWVWMMVWRWTNWQQAGRGRWWHGAECGVWQNELSAHRVDSMRHTWLQVSRVYSGIFLQVNSGGYHPCIAYLWAQGAGLSHTFQIQAKGWAWGVGACEGGHNGNAYWQLKEFQSHSDFY